MTHIPRVQLTPFSRQGVFRRGARHILVDGVEWGHTLVEFHGLGGTTHTFKQEHGGVIADESVRIQPSDPNRSPTKEKITTKVLGLIASGKLIHPDDQLAKNKKSNGHEEEIRAAEERLFRAQAEGALHSARSPDELIDHIIRAMRWAQNQPIKWEPLS